MATVSFDKEFIIKDKEYINKFSKIILEENKTKKIDIEKVSETNMERGRILLKQYLSR
ncbi:MAG: hypothetical protein ACRC3Y_14170 [Romboutsia sp.]|uniref:hypothetical protein n=1 Tax=Romboutsia sp. TaxID=1965302 RepID=UPI003F3F5340